MAFIIPWIFRAGTKAKSAEVNENFLAVKQFVDLLEEDVAANQIMVQTLDDTKANVNGNPTERFQVATAIVGNDAVNLNTLEKETQNARGYIDGYELSATSNRVSASKGSCYSYDPNNESYEYLIKSDTALSTEVLTLGANAKYYVFVCGDSAGVEYPKITTTTNTTTPSLPAGLDCWRRLGSFTTDDDGRIDEILKEGQQSLLGFTGFIDYLIDSRIIQTDYDNPLEVTADQNMYLFMTLNDYTNRFSGWAYIDIKINEQWQLIACAGISDHVHHYFASTFVPIKKGQEYRIRGDAKVVLKRYAMGG